MMTDFASAGSTSDAEERVFLVQRLSKYGLAGAGLGALAFPFRIPHLLTGQFVYASVYAHFAGIAICIGLWLYTRRLANRAAASTESVSPSVIAGQSYAVQAPTTPASPRFLRLIDTGVTLATAMAYGVMGWAMQQCANRAEGNTAELVLLLVLSYIVTLRAAVVPSSARRTAFVTAACALALVPVSLPGVLSEIGRENDAALRSLVMSFMWWTLATVLASVTSGVIYGLRREIRSAREIGQYHLLERIGQGGMGIVYRARHRLLRRDTALKLLPPSRSASRAVTRFEREVRLTAQLSHPNTVTVFDYGRTPDGVFYYAMELLDGATLEDVVRTTGPMPPARVVHILKQIAGSLAEAHELGLVHRDIKPSNIMICFRGGQPDVAKVLDFGLVRDKVTTARVDGLSVASEILGTPQYMAPEAIVAPETVSAASDLYSLGAVVYFLLTGRPLFEANTLIEICTHQLHTAAEAPSTRVTVPKELDALVLQCLAKDAATRPSSARAIIEAVERLDLSAFTGWSDADARTWWTEHEGALARERKLAVAAESGGSADAKNFTLEIDLERRERSSLGGEADAPAPTTAIPQNA